MKRASIWSSLFAVAMLVPPLPAHAQNQIIPAAVGAFTGTGAGGYVALGIVAFRARQGKYLFGIEDAFGWESAAVLAGSSTGIALGLWDPDRLRNTIVATAGLGLVGTAVGAVVGRQIWPPPEGTWAGGVIGGGAGVLLGAVVGVLMPPDAIWSDDTETGLPFLVRIPFGG